MEKQKKVLHIDGEYLEKANFETGLLKKSLKRILGEVGYPTHLIYYGTCIVSTNTIAKLGELGISNIEINTEGYITTLSEIGRAHV